MCETFPKLKERVVAAGIALDIRASILAQVSRQAEWSFNFCGISCLLMTTKNIQSELNKLSFTCLNPLADIFHLTNKMTCLLLLVAVHSIPMSCQGKYVSDKRYCVTIFFFSCPHSCTGWFTSFPISLCHVVHSKNHLKTKPYLCKWL